MISTGERTKLSKSRINIFNRFEIRTVSPIDFFMCGKILRGRHGGVFDVSSGMLLIVMDPPRSLDLKKT